MVSISGAERRANSLYKQSRKGKQIKTGKDKGGKCGISDLAEG
jgi:hypothetical protein